MIIATTIIIRKVFTGTSPKAFSIMPIHKNKDPTSEIIGPMDFLFLTAITIEAIMHKLSTAIIIPIAFSINNLLFLLCAQTKPSIYGLLRTCFYAFHAKDAFCAIFALS